MMEVKKIALVIFVNLAIALGFYYDNLDANVTEISSDLANIIPICKKLDNPQLYANDVFLDDINGVKYYTPAYVGILRFFAYINGGDYLQALNALNFWMHLCYGLFWFLLFYAFRRDFWMAFIFSIFFRGILWPPGGELLGVSDLWTAMPRTLFMALAPLPFLVYTYTQKYKVHLAALMAGLLVNIHPISGVGAVIGYFSIYCLYQWYTVGLDSKFYRKMVAVVLLCLTGMLPYVLIYTLNVKITGTYSQELFDLAFRKRLGSLFTDPIAFIKNWNRPILYFFASFFVGFYFIDRSQRKRDFKILFFTLLIVFFTANLSVYIESAVNGFFNKNIRMSFQLIRYQKFLLVLLQIGTYAFLVALVQKYHLREIYKGIAAFCFLVVLSASSLPAFSKVPLIGDDLLRLTLPNTFKFHKESQPVDNDMLDMISYAQRNTPPNSVFYNTYLLRTAMNAPVVLDAKSAGMLLEGNPEAFIQWYVDSEKLEKMSIPDKIALLKARHVQYILVDSGFGSLVPIKTIGKWQLYKLQ